MTTKEDKEAFISRWSRLKQETKNQPPQKPENAPADPADPKAAPPELPPVDQLTFESDYRGFLHPKVGEDVRRAAFRKLFSDPHFSAIDMMDVYIDDYSQTVPIPAAMLAQLKQAQNILQWAKEDEEKTAQEKLQRESSKQALEAPAAQPLPGAEVAVNAPDSVPATTDGAGGQAKS